jgi:hypothetical protein
LSATKKGVRPDYQGGVYPRLVLVVVVLLALYVNPRNPPMRPRMRPMKFIDSMEKTSTRVLPSLRWAALLNSSQDPTSVSIPATLPQIRSRLLGNPGTSSDPIALARNAPIRVNSPASSDSAKAAVGFGSTFTAKAHPYRRLRVKTIKEL